MKYCKDCKYLRYRYYCVSACQYGISKYVLKELDILDLRVNVIPLLDFNRHGRCKNYKRKWWKFWRTK